MTVAGPTGDDLVEMLAALANPLRLRIIAKLAGGRDYVSHLAREIGVSRPLLHLHLQRLEAAGLIVGSLELSEDGKAMKFYEVADFDLHLSAPVLAEAARTPDQADPGAGIRAKGAALMFGAETTWPEAIIFLGVLLAALFLIGIAVSGLLEFRKTKLLAAQEDNLRQLAPLRAAR